MTFSAGCSAAVVGELDEASAGEVGSLLNNNATSTRRLAQRLPGQRAAGVELDDVVEVHAVDPLEPGRHSGRIGHSGGPPNASSRATAARSLSA